MPQFVFFCYGYIPYAKFVLRRNMHVYSLSLYTIGTWFCSLYCIPVEKKKKVPIILLQLRHGSMNAKTNDYRIPK